MRMLVTGGAGVIGALVVPKLLKLGVEVVVLDNRADFSLMPPGLKAFEFFETDIRDFEKLSAQIARAKVDRIVHLAAFIDPEMAVLPYVSFTVNTLGTTNVLESARRAGIARVVAASSRAVYGEVPEVGSLGYKPITEDHPKKPVSAYDVTKCAAEMIGKLYRDVHGVEYSALRFAGIYGPGKQARHGKLALRSRLVEDPFQGKPVRITGGDQLDDIIYVDDVAEGIVKAAMGDRLYHHAYNIASGKGQTLRQFADAVRKAIPGADIEVGPGLNPLGLPTNHYAIYDISRARQDLGFEPRFSLEDGVRDYVDRLRGSIHAG